MASPSRLTTTEVSNLCEAASKADEDAGLPNQGRWGLEGDCKMDSHDKATHCAHGNPIRCCTCGTYKDPLLAKVSLAASEEGH